MSINPFAWLRAAAKAAVIGGVEDALREIQPEVESLEVGGLHLALPAAAEGEEPPALNGRARRKVTPA